MITAISIVLVTVCTFGIVLFLGIEGMLNKKPKHKDSNIHSNK